MWYAERQHWTESCDGKLTVSPSGIFRTKNAEIFRIMLARCRGKILLPLAPYCKKLQLDYTSTACTKSKLQLVDEELRIR